MSPELAEFVVGAAFNLVVAILIVRFVYYPLTQNKSYVFTFVAFNTVIYCVLSVLTSAEISVGVGFGLFAIFSVLRYRTDPMPIREMTYLFIIIALPVMNSALAAARDFSHLLTANAAIVVLLYVLEKGWGFHFEASKKINYDKIELITPENRERLLADLRERTGLPVRWVEIGRIDFLSDTAEIKIYYEDVRKNYWREEAGNEAD